LPLANPQLWGDSCGEGETSMARHRNRLVLLACTAAPAALILASAPAAARERMVEVGPIWNDMDAQRKCAEAARQAGGAWTGQ
jgi:hypothetical protein